MTKKITEGTDSLFVMSPDDIMNIPKDLTVTYARMVVDYRPQKDDTNPVRMTFGGNLVKYLGELTTCTADITTSKIMWNIVLITQRGII